MEREDGQEGQEDDEQGEEGEKEEPSQGGGHKSAAEQGGRRVCLQGASWDDEEEVHTYQPACNREKGRKYKAKEVIQGLKEQVRAIHPEIRSLEVKLAE